MKTKTSLSILLILSLLTGCKSTGNNQQQITVSVLQLGAQTATALTLSHRPQLLPAFQSADVALTALAGQTNLAAGDLARILAGLNLGGKDAIIVAATFAGTLNLIGSLEAQNTNNAALRADILAVRDGNRSGIQLATLTP